MSSRIRSLAAAMLIVVIGAGGFLFGVQLGERASQPSTDTLTFDRPSAASPRDVAIRSVGGFTGFEEGAIAGVVVRSGVTSDPEEGVFSVRTDSATMRIRTTQPVRLYRITELEGALEAGDVVVIRLDGDGAAEAILRIPPDLREGDSRAGSPQR